VLLPSALEEFEDNPPFTIQRLCEARPSRSHISWLLHCVSWPDATAATSQLLLEPGKHYARAPKLHHALEKLLTVTSTAPAGAEAARAAAAARAARAAAADAAARAAPVSGGSSDRGGGSPSEGPALLIDRSNTGADVTAEFRLFSGVVGLEGAPDAAAQPHDAAEQPPPAPAEEAGAAVPMETSAPEQEGSDAAAAGEAHGGGATGAG
jgi:hypothetical protein